MMFDQVPDPHDCDQCWYCNAYLADRHEHDHVIPRAAGGTLMVPACMNCHELKDRSPFVKWHVEALYNAISAIPEGPPRELLTLLYESTEPCEPSVALAALKATPQRDSARLLLAKATSVVLQRQALKARINTPST